MLSRSESQVFIGEGNELDSNHTITQRMPFKNRTMEEFFQGKLSEQTVQDYYEILKKADIFIKESTPLKLATTADKLSMNLVGSKAQSLGANISVSLFEMKSYLSFQSGMKI